MDNNEYCRRIRYALLLDDTQTRRLMSLGGLLVELSEVASWRCKDTEPEYQPCPAKAIYALLDGLIIERRGPPPDAGDTAVKTAGAESGEAHKSIDNNRVLKQLRIALALKSDDVHELVLSGGGKLGKSEIGALFRKTGARNYRRCGDQVIRWFLSGLAARRE